MFEACVPHHNFQTFLISLTVCQNCCGVLSGMSLVAHIQIFILLANNSIIRFPTKIYEQTILCTDVLSN